MRHVWTRAVQDDDHLNQGFFHSYVRTLFCPQLCLHSLFSGFWVMFVTQQTNRLTQPITHTLYTQRHFYTQNLLHTAAFKHFST